MHGGKTSNSSYTSNCCDLRINRDDSNRKSNQGHASNSIEARRIREPTGQGLQQQHRQRPCSSIGAAKSGNQLGKDSSNSRDVSKSKNPSCAGTSSTSGKIAKAEITGISRTPSTAKGPEADRKLIDVSEEL